MKKCEVSVGGDKFVSDFYGVFQFSEIINPSLMIGGHPGGVRAYPVAVIGFDDGLRKVSVDKIYRIYEVEDEGKS